MDTLGELYLRFTFDLVGTQPFDHLHWGLFDGVAKEPGQLAAAQQRYAERLLELVPAEVRSVIDVGCGLGGIARLLADSGRQVLAIGPREDHCRLLAARRYPGIEVHQGTLQALPAQPPADLLLFAESFNFFVEQAPGGEARSVAGFVELCRPRLREGGFVLIADVLSGPMHQALCAAADFTPLQDRDVHEAAAYTAQALQARLEREAVPYQKLLLEVLEHEEPALARRVRDTIARLPNQALRELLQGRMVEAQQAESRRYRMLLLQRR